MLLEKNVSSSAPPTKKILRLHIRKKHAEYASAESKLRFLSTSVTCCKNIAVSNFDAEWLLGDNVLCDILMVYIQVFFFHICTKSQSLYK